MLKMNAMQIIIHIYQSSLVKVKQEKIAKGIKRKSFRLWQAQ
jgi:hypothetical protein